jgi:3-hydroxybutyryl-CoA dehydrogenase
MQKGIWILGDSPLVEEYTALCVEKGLSVKSGVEPNTVADLALELTNICFETKKKNLIHFDRTLPLDVPILSSSVAVMITEQATWVLKPSRVVGIGAFPTLLQGSMIEFAVSDHTDNSTQKAAEEFATLLGKSSAFVEDSVGMVMPRILSMLINEACFATMEGVAEAKDIDTAMKLGTNYPHGPVEWAERVGAKHVHAVVSALYKHFGEDRYRCAPLLHKAALRNSFE